MPRNEKRFRRKFLQQFGALSLAGKVLFPPNANRLEVSITADDSVVLDDRRIFIEIDSGNAAKLLIGQYVLLSHLCRNDRQKIIFVVVHYYKNYNSERTKRYFRHVASHFLRDRAIPFVMFGEKEFWNMASNLNNLEDLWQELINRLRVD